jgi:hypothetical protein
MYICTIYIYARRATYYAFFIPPLKYRTQWTGNDSDGATLKKSTVTYNKKEIGKTYICV